jgi:hypothetical protein
MESNEKVIAIFVQPMGMDALDDGNYRNIYQKMKTDPFSDDTIRAGGPDKAFLELLCGGK